MKVKASERIRLSSGETMTLGEAFDLGLVYPKTTEGYGKNSTVSTHYIAKEKGGEGLFWEIGKLLYESRGGISKDRELDKLQASLRKL